MGAKLMNRRGFLGRIGVAVAAIVGAPAALRAIARFAPAESEVYPVSVQRHQWIMEADDVSNARGVVTAVDHVRGSITVEWGNVEQGNGGKPFPCRPFQFGRSEAPTSPFPAARS